MKSVLLRGFRHGFQGAVWLKFGQLGSLDWVEMFPVGPPCRARLDLVHFVKTEEDTEPASNARKGGIGWNLAQLGS